jgi:hypothetical protein
VTNKEINETPYLELRDKILNFKHCKTPGTIVITADIAIYMWHLQWINAFCLTYKALSIAYITKDDDDDDDDDDNISEELTHGMKKGNRAYDAYNRLITSILINKYNKSKPTRHW